MAFCWAVEPSAFSVPVEQVGAAAAEDEPADDPTAGAEDEPAPAAPDVVVDDPPELEQALNTTAHASRAAVTPAL
jgi:hypothetical protein